ncbi:MAG: RNA polymerase factor sigma-54 [Methylobacteriaceae bacterium]|nr:RNA polymerase factor sigma-54 [Methylobacteriaceae bacterium]
MGLSTKLMLRQGQALVMTPQLLQAIKLLQLSNIELAAFVETELERNPLLERAEEVEAGDPGGEARAEPFEAEAGAPAEGERDWDSATLETSAEALQSGLDADLGNTFEAERTPATQERAASGDALGLSEGAWAGAGSGAGGGDGEAPNLEAYVAEKPSLREHLTMQLAVACPDPIDRLIGGALIDLIDESGYLQGDLADIAERLGASPARVEQVLAIVHSFEPTGVGARNLAECLTLQLKERDRCDPAMQALLANLPLLARRDFATLKRFCGVDDEDLADMVQELRRLDPKPGRAFGGEVEAPAAPDVFVRAAADGSWQIELNSEALPRILVNHAYAARVARPGASEADRTFISGCLQSANWLTKSLEQRARTILKVASEIVRQQDGFFALGVEHLRPLNLKTVADAIGMHESTVSRVTSGKYMATPRGLFELKYFFTAAIAATGGGESHSAEAVRFRIRQMIDQENPDDVLSDDAIVARLREAKIDIARRTVAKYRESLRIPSSIERRREKQAQRARTPEAAQ